MRRPSYDRVPTTESECGHVSKDKKQNIISFTLGDEIKVKTKLNWISEKIHALIWIILAILVAKYTRLFHVLISPKDYDSSIHENQNMESSPPIHVVHNTLVSKPYHFLLYGAIVLGMVHLSFLLYLAVYLPCVRKIHGIHAWNVYHPRAIPTMTFCGFFSIFLFIRSLWPLYGWTTPYIIAIELMGFLSLLHFIPWK